MTAFRPANRPWRRITALPGFRNFTIFACSAAAAAEWVVWVWVVWE
uniref:Uncharacterized protein n=1 Tax=Triticum urartu TaxID=4572 RepID=A0A8R7QG24_TRIUA